jgi:hypothetical protein
VNNQRLTMLRTLAALLCLATPALADQIIDLQGGVPTPIPGTDLTVMFSAITDNRCPSNTTCAWEGMIKAEITVLTGTRTPTTLILCNACDEAGIPQTVAGKTFTLGKLSPTPEFLSLVSRTIDLELYTLQVTVSP